MVINFFRFTVLPILLCSLIFILGTGPLYGKNSRGVITIGLLDQATINANVGGNFEQVNQFVSEYWQAWGFKQQQEIQLVYLSGQQMFPALAAGQIDVVGLTTITGADPDNFYSIPYARFKQRIFKQLHGNDKSKTQLAIHSPRTSTLSFLTADVERDYFDDIDAMLANYQDYDALYSIRPWVLEAKLRELKLINEFYINTDEAPDIYFHFATRKTDRALMAQINDGLRGVSKTQALQWQQQFIHADENKFSFTLGDYIQNLSEPEKQFIIAHNHLTYPIFTAGFPPYIINKSFINIKERGLTMDVLNHITNKTGLIFNSTSVNGMRDGATKLKNNEVDFFAISLKNSQNAAKLLYSNTYFNSNFSLVFRHDYPLKGSLDSLDNEVIAVIEGFSATGYLQQQLPTGTIKQFNTVNDAISAVAKGDANAYIGESLNNAYIIKHGKLSNLTSVPFNDFMAKAELAFASKAENTSLITLFNRTLNSLSETEADNMYAVWSKTAFSDASAKKEVQDAYQKASMVLALVILSAILLLRFYIRQNNFRKASQREVEQALAVAQAARKAAEHSAQTKINFLARMSHEIRTPMNGILGMAESLTFTSLTDVQKGYLSTLTDSADNLLVLLNDILDFAKMDAGKLTLESQSVNIAELAELVLNAVRHIEKEKNIRLALSLDKALHQRYFTDPFRLTQVLNNLISNAIKFTEQGEIGLVISLVERNSENDNTYDTIKINVNDTGIGISAKQQKQLFSPFIQADSAVTRKYGGTGLGLSICQEIVSAMGSKIEIESAPNVGSDFYFLLTLKQAVSVTPKKERRKQPRQVLATETDKFSQLNVLMAEDNLVNIKVLSAQLERLNITADVAENGQEALNLFKEKKYHIVLSDCHMPILDGYELAGILAQQKQQNIPWLIAITADALEGTADKCIAAGFDDYIAKPCTQETVNNKLHHALRQITAEEPTYQPPAQWDYQLFQPDLLMEQNDQDIVLCKKIVQVFNDIWQTDKAALFKATLAKDFHHIYGLVHRLKGSIRYFCDESIECNAVLIEKQAQLLQGDMIEFSIKLFIKELDILSEELTHWLTQLNTDK
ncbi:MAG: ATP-binding protein [Thalassotalea sp.]